MVNKSTHFQGYSTKTVLVKGKWGVEEGVILGKKIFFVIYNLFLIIVFILFILIILFIELC